MSHFKQKLKANLDFDELTAVKKNLQAQKIQVNEEFVSVIQ